MSVSASVCRLENTLEAEWNQLTSKQAREKYNDQKKKKKKNSLEFTLLREAGGRVSGCDKQLPPRWFPVKWKQEKDIQACST